MGQEWMSVNNIPLLKSQLDMIKVQCVEKGCCFIGTRAEYLEHKEICGFKQMECDSCSQQIKKRNLDEHRKECVPVPCPYCLNLVRPAELKAHEEDLSKCIGITQEDFLREMKHPLLAKLLKPPAVVVIDSEPEDLTERMCTATGCQNPRGIARYVSQAQLNSLPVSDTETHSTYLLVGDFAAIQFPKDQDKFAVCETCARRVERAVHHSKMFSATPVQEENSPKKLQDKISISNKRKWEEDKQLKDKIMNSLGTRELLPLLRQHDITTPRNANKFTMVDLVAEAVKNKKIKMQEIEKLAEEEEPSVKDKLLEFNRTQLAKMARKHGLKFSDSGIQREDIADMIIQESKKGNMDIDKLVVEAV